MEQPPSVARTIPSTHVIVFCSTPLVFSKFGVLRTENGAAPWKMRDLISAGFPLAAYFFCPNLISSTWCQAKAQGQKKKSCFARKYSLVENLLQTFCFCGLLGRSSQSCQVNTIGYDDLNFKGIHFLYTL